jgi:hypothetical protein
LNPDLEDDSVAGEPAVDRLRAHRREREPSQVELPAPLGDRVAATC